MPSWNALKRHTKKGKPSKGKRDGEKEKRQHKTREDARKGKERGKAWPRL